MVENPHIGESFDSFLHDEGIYDEVKATAIRRTIALQIQHANLRTAKGQGPRK
jgi:hypothetical protein